MRMRYLLIGVVSIAMMNLLCGCNYERQDKGGNDTSWQSPEEVELQDSILEADTVMAAEQKAHKTDYTWLDKPCDDKPVPLNFAKWMVMMDHIYDHNWKRPTAKMLADVGLKRVYESDKVDSFDGIKDVNLIYGRDVKEMTDSAGLKYYALGGNHSILFQVMAYTSSGAEIMFQNPADMQDFMRQVVNYGVAASPSGDLIICDKPMGKGIHKIKKDYPQESKKGSYCEKYLIYPIFDPDKGEYSCQITLDFLRNRLDIKD